MSKGEMAVIVTISWIAGLVVLALVFTISDAEPSDFPRMAPSDRMVNHIQSHLRSADKQEEKVGK